MPDEVGEQVERLRDDFGVEYVVFSANGGMVARDKMLKMIVLFGEQVIAPINTAGNAVNAVNAVGNAPINAATQAAAS